jgi:hypothetical protein
VKIRPPASNNAGKLWSYLFLDVKRYPIIGSYDLELEGVTRDDETDKNLADPSQHKPRHEKGKMGQTSLRSSVNFNL